MLSYRLKCRKNAGYKNPKVEKIEKQTKMLISNCTVCGSEKSKFIKEQEAKLWLINTGKISLLGSLLI